LRRSIGDPSSGGIIPSGREGVKPVTKKQQGHRSNPVALLFLVAVLTPTGPDGMMLSREGPPME
jgi:hypothetical protein